VARLRVRLAAGVALAGEVKLSLALGPQMSRPGEVRVVLSLDPAYRTRCQCTSLPPKPPLNLYRGHGATRARSHLPGKMLVYFSASQAAPKSLPRPWSHWSCRSTGWRHQVRAPPRFPLDEMGGAVQRRKLCSTSSSNECKSLLLKRTIDG
jgi:hypothetical protein